MMHVALAGVTVYKVSFFTCCWRG